MEPATVAKQRVSQSETLSVFSKVLFCFLLLVKKKKKHIAKAPTRLIRVDKSRKKWEMRAKTSILELCVCTFWLALLVVGMKFSLIVSFLYFFFCVRVCRVLLKQNYQHAIHESIFALHTVWSALKKNPKAGTSWKKKKKKSCLAWKSTVSSIKSRLHIPTVIRMKSRRVCRLIFVFEVCDIRGWKASGMPFRFRRACPLTSS